MVGRQATDVALPAEAALIDVLPAILPQFGAECVEQGADHEGWVVQRLGETPLDEERTLAELNLLDGETVYLRPRADQLAAIDYDDLVDGVGEQLREHRSTWTPAHSRGMFRFGSVLVLLFVLWLMAGAGTGTVQAVAALSLATLMLGGSAMVARGTSDPPAATIMAGAAVCFGALGGWQFAVAFDPVAMTAIRATCAMAAALVFLSAGLAAVVDAALLFAGAIMLLLVLLVPGLIGALTVLTLPQAAGIGLAVSLIMGVFVPATAFRLSGLSLPMLPTGADELSEDIEPVPAPMVVERGAAVVGYSTALHVGLGGAQALLLPVLISDGDDWPMALSLVMAFLLFLRARHPTATAQRWSMMAPAIVSVVANLRVVAAGQTEFGKLAVVCLPLFVAGLLMLLASRILPGKRLRPYWGRAVEILESLTAIAILPLLLQVLDVFATMRGLAG